MNRRYLLVFISLVVTTGIFAQRFENESEYYPKTFAIESIYSHALGYRVDYIRQDYSIDTLWLPAEWFKSADSVGQIAYGKGVIYPYMTLFYKNGQLDHFRLYLQENKSHPSWKLLKSGVDHSDKFPSPDSELVLTYQAQ